MGSSLQAELEFNVPTETFDALNSLDDDLRFVMITSSAKVYKLATGGVTKIAVTVSPHSKCERCWHYRADVGADAAHPTICSRCVSNLFATGEARHFA